MGISLSDDLSSNKIAEQYIKRYWGSKQNSTEETSMFYGLLEYITDKQVKMLCCKHAKRFAHPLEVHFETCDFSKFYRLVIAHGPDCIPSTDGSLDTLLTGYDVGLHLSTICKHSTMHEALIINSARSCIYLINPKLLAEVGTLIYSSSNVGIQLNAHLLLARHDESRIPQAVSVSHEYHCLPVEVELALTNFQQSKKQKMPSSHMQLAHKILFLLSLNKRKLISAYEEILGIHRGEADECYMEQWNNSEYLEGKLVADCYLLPHECQNIWVQILPQNRVDYPIHIIFSSHSLSLQNRNRDIDAMYIISSSHLLSSIKEHLKNGLRTVTMNSMDKIDTSLCKETGKRFNPVDISYSLECCQLMLLVHHSAVKLLREYHSIERSHYFPLCTNFIPWVESMKIAFNHLQTSTKKWLGELSPAEQHDLGFLKLWEQASVAKLTPTLKRFQSSAAIIKWIDVCNEVIDDPLESCSKFFKECLPELTLLDINCYSSIIDSISIYGTIALAMLSCVSDSSSPILIPEMYYRALQVYDSLLPKAHDHILDSCYSHMVKKSLDKLLQYLHLALNQIEVLLQNRSYSRLTLQISDLPRLTTILVLTLYMNYAKLSKTPDLSDLRSKFVHHLRENIIIKFQNFNLLAVCNAFQEARNPLSLVRVLKYLLCPDSKEERYESLAIIYFSKRHNKIVIESVDDKDIKLPPEIQAQELSDQQHIPISPLIPKHKRQRHLYFNLSSKHVYHGPIRTESSAPVWMHYKERSEDVHEHVRTFIRQIISKDPVLASSISDKTLFQQYLHCLHHFMGTSDNIN